MDEVIEKVLDRLEEHVDYNGSFTRLSGQPQEILRAFAQAVLFQGLRRVKRNLGELRPREYKGNALVGMWEVFDVLDQSLKETE